jgi:hypothetical protein
MIISEVRETSCFRPKRWWWKKCSSEVSRPPPCAAQTRGGTTRARSSAVRHALSCCQLCQTWVGLSCCSRLHCR